MNRMKRDEESCESGPRGFSRRAGGMERRENSARALTRSAFSGFSRTGQRQEGTQGLAQRRTCMLFWEETETGKKMNGMAGKGFSGLQNPVNPVILSKPSIEVLQTSRGWETVKRLWIGCLPVRYSAALVSCSRGQPAGPPAPRCFLQKELDRPHGFVFFSNEAKGRGIVAIGILAVRAAHRG